MKNILFANTVEPACGVHQFGVNFYNNLHSLEFSYFYDHPTSIQDVKHFIAEENIQAVIVNWHPDIGGWPEDIFSQITALKGIPFCLLYHDGESGDLWDAILFSDPTMEDHGKWFSVPRPIPKVLPDREGLASKSITSLLLESDKLVPMIGCHGFYGASANMVVTRVSKEFEKADIYLHVPTAKFGDENGQLLMDVLRLCSYLTDSMPGIKVIPDFRFHTTEDLVSRLSTYDLNCYFRPVEPEWKGVSSALDLAVASGRPLAINKCKGFRHLHNLNPSICIEDRSLKEIINTGTEPLKPFIEANTPEKLTEKVDYVMERVLG